MMSTLLITIVSLPGIMHFHCHIWSEGWDDDEDPHSHFCSSALGILPSWDSASFELRVSLLSLYHLRHLASQTKNPVHDLFSPAVVCCTQDNASSILESSTWSRRPCLVNIGRLEEVLGRFVKASFNVLYFRTAPSKENNENLGRRLDKFNSGSASFCRLLDKYGVCGSSASNCVNMRSFMN